MGVIKYRQVGRKAKASGAFQSQSTTRSPMRNARGSYWTRAKIRAKTVAPIARPPDATLIFTHASVVLPMPMRDNARKRETFHAEYRNIAIFDSQVTPINCLMEKHAARKNSRDRARAQPLHAGRACGGITSNLKTNGALFHALEFSLSLISNSSRPAGWGARWSRDGPVDLPASA